MRLVPVGKIVGCHGVRGAVRVRCFNTPPSPLVAEASTLWVGSGPDDAIAHTVETMQTRHADLLVKFTAIPSRTAAAGIVGRFVSLPESTFPPLREGEFYYHEVVGFRVMTTEGAGIGTIQGTFFTGGSDVWIVEDGEREHLIPVIADVVRSLDRKTRTVTIEIMEGLLTEEPRAGRRRPS